MRSAVKRVTRWTGRPTRWTPASGRVVESRQRLGQEVAAGEVLLRLDGEVEGFSPREEREKVAALGSKTTEVRGRAAWVRADVTVSFHGFDAAQFKVERASITEPRNSIGVRIYDPRDDK
jgi:multidrug resistance efflux pump